MIEGIVLDKGDLDWLHKRWVYSEDLLSGFFGLSSTLFEIQVLVSSVRISSSVETVPSRAPTPEVAIVVDSSTICGVACDFLEESPLLRVVHGCVI